MPRVFFREIEINSQDSIIYNMEPFAVNDSNTQFDNLASTNSLRLCIQSRV